MSEAAKAQSVAEMLKPLIAQARTEGKWLWCSYQDLWFSPDQLAKENANGQFCWGPVNWRLRDPEERVSAARRTVLAAEEEYERVKQDVRGTGR